MVIQQCECTKRTTRWAVHLKMVLCCVHFATKRSNYLYLLFLGSRGACFPEGPGFLFLIVSPSLYLACQKQRFFELIMHIWYKITFIPFPFSFKKWNILSPWIYVGLWLSWNQLNVGDTMLGKLWRQMIISNASSFLLVQTRSWFPQLPCSPTTLMPKLAQIDWPMEKT